MKKLFFIIILLGISLSIPKALDVPKFVSQKSKCVEVNENVAIIPVNVIVYRSGDLVSLIDDNILGLIDNDETYEITIDNLKSKNVENIFISSLKDNNNQTYINYSIEKDIHLNAGDNLMAFDLVINFKETIPDKMDILGDEVIIGDKDTCSFLNKENSEIVRTEVFFKKGESYAYIYILVIIILLMLAILEFIVILRRKK